MPYKIPSTADPGYSPHDLLPAPEPKTVNPPEGQFYHQVSKHLIKDIVRIMHNGIPIDLDKVEKLEAVLDSVLADVKARLSSNTLIQQFQSLQHKTIKADYIVDKRSKMRTPKYYLKDFVLSKMDHRSYFMQQVLKDLTNPFTPEDTLPTGVPKWPALLCKRHAAMHPAIQLLVNKKLKSTNKYAKAAMKQLAVDRATMYNKAYHNLIADVDKVELPEFNPASSLQKGKLFAWLGLTSDKVSKDTGLPSWDRDEVERVNKETTDKDIVHFTQAFIDFSFSAIVKQNFIAGFYEYTHNGRLHGGIKLFGAKSFRLTSSNPNLLNMPSTRSIYSKPIKQCLVAPPGKVILAIDYGALEDRVIASLSRDTNKCSIFLDGLDGHCLNAYGYFKEEIAELMTLTGDTRTDVTEFYRLVESGHKLLKAIRQKGKPATFGLSYGSYPPKVASSLKISLPAAEAIFNRYHEVLYPGITEYREKYVLPTAKEYGRIHLGLGCYISTDSPRKDIRTLNNATCQFWSLLTLLAINKVHQLIDASGLQNSIECISTIYDSIYYVVDDDPVIIQVLNDWLVPVLTRDFMEDQTIANEATAEIGYDWADMKQVPHNASTKDIQTVLDDLLAKEGVPLKHPSTS